MFEIFENKDSRTTAEKQEKLMDILTKAVLASDAAPESLKLRLRILDKCRDVARCLSENIVEKYCLTGSEADNDTLKKALKYLLFIEDDIKQFSKSTPAASGIKNIEQED